MNFLAIFIPLFLIAFLVLPFLCYFVRIRSDKLAKFCPPGSRCRGNRQRNRNRRQLRELNVEIAVNQNDRQGNIFTISDETSANTGTNRYPDFFYLEPNSDEAARIRAQLEKDDKDLPSYDEVMRMPVTPLTPPATLTVTAPPSLGNTTSSTTISSSNSMPPTVTSPRSPPPPPLDMTVPPYSETPPSYQAAASLNNASTSVITPAMPATASTSRGASVTIPINNSISNTSV